MAQSLLLDTASGWELATKVRLGKLPGAEGLLQDLPSLLHQQGFQPLAVQLHYGVHAGGYRQAHRDPFDRLLAAQAELEGLHLVSLDPALATFPLPPALVKDPWPFMVRSLMPPPLPPGRGSTAPRDLLPMEFLDGPWG